MRAPNLSNYKQKKDMACSTVVCQLLHFAGPFGLDHLIRCGIYCSCALSPRLKCIEFIVIAFGVCVYVAASTRPHSKWSRRRRKSRRNLSVCTRRHETSYTCSIHVRNLNTPTLPSIHTHTHANIKKNILPTSRQASLSSSTAEARSWNVHDQTETGNALHMARAHAHTHSPSDRTHTHPN